MKSTPTPTNKDDGTPFLFSSEAAYERDADAFFCAPYDTAGDARAVPSQNEMIGDGDTLQLPLDDPNLDKKETAN
jgi:hypothetical protein